MQPFSTSYSLFNSIGVNTHLNYGDENYGNVQLVLDQLRALGVRHVRDGLHNWPNVDAANVLFNAYVRIAALGIRFNCVVDATEQIGPINSALLNQFYWLSGMGIECFEGPNEKDVNGGATWIADTRAFQQTLYAASRTMAQGISMPIIGPSMAFAANGQQLGSLYPWLDFGNLHPYPGGVLPSVIFTSNPTQQYLAQYISGSKPVMATESGYHNATSVDTTQYQLGVDEATAAKYIERMLILNWVNGLRRTYLYELQDAGDDNTLTVENDHWGLTRWDGSEKPAFQAVKNLITLYRSGEGDAPVAALNATVSATGVQTALFQHTASTWLLAMWQEVNSYGVTVPPVPAQVALGTQANVTEYRPLLQSDPTYEFGVVRTVSVPVPDHPVILRIG